MRWPPLLPLLVIAACSGGPDDTLGATTSSSDGGTTAGGTESGTSTAASASATSVGTASTSTTSTTTATTATTGDPTTGATTAASGPTTSTTTTTAGPGTGEVTTADATTDDPTTTTGESGGDVDLCAPALVGDPCESDDDCAIAGDCCSCVAYNPSMSSPGNCGGNCKQDRCSEWELSAAACEAGVCVVAGKSCNQDKVLCKVAVPECPAGSLPQVVGDCYTGECLPIEACDWVPECELCKGSVCAITQGPDCTHRRCVPAIPECDGLPPCACLGEIFCQPPHDQCSEDQGDLVCGL